MRTGLRKIAEIHKGEFRLTPNQNLIIAKREEARPQADRRAPAPARARQRPVSACGSTPWPAWRCRPAASPWPKASATCPSLVDALDEILDEAGLRQDEIVIRMTGCPNGCARPYLAEIGLVGRGPGTYNLYLGAAFDGTRLNKLYRQDVGHDEIVAALRPLLQSLCHRAPGRRALRRLRRAHGRGAGDPQRTGLPRRLIA